jgi:hypothetical protein
MFREYIPRPPKPEEPDPFLIAMIIATVGVIILITWGFAL